MRVLYLSLLSLIAFSFITNAGTENEPDSTLPTLQSVDVKYNLELDAFVVDFTTCKYYKAVMFKVQSGGYTYKLFYKDVLIESRESIVIDNVTVNIKTGEEALTSMIEDIKNYRQMLLAIAD